LVEGDWDGKTQDFDGTQMDSAHHVWIDHCHFHHIGDGMIDSRLDTTHLTVSWNVLSDPGERSQAAARAVRRATLDAGPLIFRSPVPGARPVW
jgi:pectate lyase